MTHDEVFNQYTRLFPNYAYDQVETWFQNGKNSIRIRLIDHRQFVFTIYGKKDWRFETLDSYIDRTMKG